MAPLITDIKELRFDLRLSKTTLTIKQFKAETDADFISTQGSGERRDITSFFSGGTGGGIAINAFYPTFNTLGGFSLGDNLHVRDAAGQEVTVVHLDA